MSLVQHAKYYRWISQSLSRWQRSIEKYLLVFDAADVDADGPRVDPDHAGHWTQRTRNPTLRDCRGDFGDRFGVEHEVVLLEQTRNTGFVNLHLQAADAQGTKRLRPTTIHTVVVDLDAFDPQRRNRIQIGGDS